MYIIMDFLCLFSLCWYLQPCTDQRFGVLLFKCIGRVISLSLLTLNFTYLRFCRFLAMVSEDEDNQIMYLKYMQARYAQ